MFASVLFCSRKAGPAPLLVVASLTKVSLSLRLCPQKGHPVTVSFSVPVVRQTPHGKDRLSAGLTPMLHSVAIT